MATAKKWIALEKQEQAGLISWWGLSCRRWGLEAADLLHVPNEGTGDPIRGKLMQRQGVRPGCPDLLLTVARGDKHALWIELKRTKASKTTDAQRIFHARLRERGYAVEVCYGADDARRAIHAYLGAKV